MFPADTPRIQPHFDVNLNPIPGNLRPSLEVVSRSFYNSRMRNLDIFYNNETRLYGLMTNYEGSNFCWIQPTRVRSRVADHEYDQYLRKINSKDTQLLSAYNIKIGMDCIALYEADSHWYRGVVVKEVPGDRWMVLFIDYGNFQICNGVQLKQPLADPRCDHFHAPMQAVCCRIYNIVPTLPANQENIDLCLEKFFINNSDKFLEVIVRNIRPDYVVDCDIFLPARPSSSDRERFNGMHIGQRLVDAGLATFADPVAAHATSVTGPEVIDLVD